MRFPSRLAAFAVPLVAAFAHGQEPTTRHASKDGKYSFVLPAAWKTGRRKDDGSLLRLWGDLPSGGGFGLRFDRLEGMRSARAQPFVERTLTMQRVKTGKTEIAMEPVPHILARGLDGSTVYIRAVGFRTIRRCGYAITVNVSPHTAWPELRPAFFAAMASIRADEPEWPARPKGFVEVRKDGWQYLLQPGVKKASALRMHRLVGKVEKRFAEVWGPVLKPPENAPQILIYRDAGQVPVKNYKGFQAVWLEGRVYAIVVPRGDRHAEALFAEELAYVLSAQRFGDCAQWMWRAERKIAYSEILARRKLPFVAPEVYSKLPRDLPEFGIISRRDANADPYDCFAYMALFRRGPAKYREIFDRFLTDVRATSDWETAWKKHLVPLDTADLREAAKAFVAKLRMP